MTVEIKPGSKNVYFVKVRKVDSQKTPGHQPATLYCSKLQFLDINRYHFGVFRCLFVPSILLHLALF